MVRRRRSRVHLVQDTAAVSAVISVILMVAVAVVLSAAVFVLVGETGGGGAGQPPKVAGAVDSDTTSTRWVVKISDAPSDGLLADYQFVITTPDQGILVASPSNSTFTEPVDYVATLGAGTERVAAAAGTHADTDNDFQFTFTDVSGDGKWNTLDRVVVTYDSDTADAASPDAIPTGVYRFEIRHIPTDSIVTGLTQNF